MKKVGSTGLTIIVIAALLAGFQNCSLKSPEDAGGSVPSSSVTTKSTDIVFNSIPSNPTFYVGGTGVIAVVASSTGGHTLSFQWYKDGVALVGQTAASLSLPNVQVSDAGAYKIIASNSTGKNWLDVVVIVSVSPVITFSVQPSPITVTAGGGGTLTATAVSTDNQSLTYQWYKDGAILAGFNTPTLSVANAAPVIAGLYQVEVKSTVGPLQTIRSNSVKITVQGTIALGANGCVNGYCACVTPGQLNVPHAPSALEICTVKGYSTLVTFATSAGIRGATTCNASGTGCFVNQNPGNIVCSSVTCSK